MKQLITVLLAGLWAMCILPAHAQKDPEGKPIQVKVVDRATIDLPENFKKMSDKEANQKYPSTRRAVFLYHMPGSTVDFTINLNKNAAFRSKDVKVMRDIYKANLRTYFSGDLKFLSEREEKINGHPFEVFEFTARSGSKVKAQVTRYVYIMYGLYKNKVMVVHFTCPERDRTYWQPIADKAMKSLNLGYEFKKK